MARYCPKCERNVEVAREDIDVGLAIFLFCCTASIGFWIYLIIYYSQPEDRCVFCETKTQPYRPQIGSNKGYNRPVQKQNPQKKMEIPKSVPIGKIDERTGKVLHEHGKRFCPMCGATFTRGMKFCSSCGSDLRDVK